MKFLFAGTGAAIVGAILAFVLTLLLTPNTFQQLAENSQSKSKKNSEAVNTIQGNNNKNSTIISGKDNTVNIGDKNTNNTNNTKNDFNGANIGTVNQGSGNSTVIMNNK